ncbi:MAG: CDP-alcohol phosphatidyltransferase family protein [Actinomycetota bacterium]|nr:CDP-alcohol phosphatidyltransferase family protein [Actinomycetota bacterium]
MQAGYPLTRLVYRRLSGGVAARLLGTRLTPTHVTYVSAALSFGGGIAFAYRQFVLGAVLTLLGSLTDCVDGDLARLAGKQSKAGSYLDHVFDRWTDAALVLGLTFSDLETLAPVGMAALVGSFMTSYARTKAQAVGTDCEVGIGGRDARMLVLVVAGVAGAPAVGLAVVAAVGIFTAVHRMVWTIRHLDAHA